MKELVEFLKKERNSWDDKYLIEAQYFFTGNLVGDKMEEVYNDGRIVVKECGDYDYIEIFGLTDEEKSQYERFSEYKPAF